MILKESQTNIQHLASKKYRRGEAEATSIVNSTKVFNFTGILEPCPLQSSVPLGLT